jgi:anti-anti-sigma regulatory factor
MAKAIELPAIFCASEVSEVCETLKSQLSGRRKNLTLDMSKIERVDTLALQLLVSIQSSCQAKGGVLTLKNIPDAVKDASSLLGLSILSEG